MTIKDRGHQNIRALAAGPPQTVSITAEALIFLWPTLCPRRVHWGLCTYYHHLGGDKVR